MKQYLLSLAAFLIAGGTTTSVAAVPAEILARLRADGGSSCVSLAEDIPQAIQLDASTLPNNCMRVPGLTESPQLYNIELTSAIPSDYTFEYLQPTPTSYTTVTTGWDQSAMGVNFCASGGDLFYFENSDDKSVTVTISKVADTSGDLCCVNQPISWSEGKARCPTVFGENDPGVCWSTLKYFLRADSMEYTIAADIDDDGGGGGGSNNTVVVEWEDKNIENNCASVRLSSGKIFFESSVTQTIATTFKTMDDPETERCIFLQIATATFNDQYWFIKNAGVCDGKGGFELFTEQDINIGGLKGTCSSHDIVIIKNSRGSEVVLTNLNMEVFLPWTSPEGRCGTTSATGEQMPVPTIPSPTAAPIAISPVTTAPVPNAPPVSSASITSAPTVGGDDLIMMGNGTITYTNEDGETVTVEIDEDAEEGGDGKPVDVTSGSRESQQDGGLSTEAQIGVVVAVLLIFFLAVNCCFIMRLRRRQRNEAVGSNMDPVGTTVTVQDLVGGRVMVKKVIPQPDGKDIVQKTMYPTQKAASKALKGYDYDV